MMEHKIPCGKRIIAEETRGQARMSQDTLESIRRVIAGMVLFLMGLAIGYSVGTF